MGRPRLDPTAVTTTHRVLDAAVIAFAAEGIDGATLADIATAAGITRPSLLYHFASKERLYEAALARVFADIGAMIHAASTTVGTPGEDDVGTPGGPADAETHEHQLLQLVEGFAAFAVQQPATARLLLRAIVADDNPATRALLISQAVPAIDAVCALAHKAAAVETDLRATLMAIIVDVLARAAAGDAASALWAHGSARHLAERLLFPRHQAPASHRGAP
jgi:AcrR family transcriptional regulator